MKGINNIDLRTFLVEEKVDVKLRRLIFYIAVTSKYISSKIHEVNRKYAGTKNISGDEQLELDKAADKIIIERMKHSKYVKELASEEQDEVISVKMPEQGEEAIYSVTIDPLDGSSLVDVNFAVGTIVGIYKGGFKGRKSIVASMYVLYGPLTTLVLTTGKGTHEFVLNPEGEFLLSQKNIKIKEKGKLYSPGALRRDWLECHRKFIELLEKEGHKLRYSGAGVADFNQILLKGGGVFTNPPIINKPEGKLRILFELQPLAFIMEQAGGYAIDGQDDILDIIPKNIHQRSPVYFGSKYEIELARKCWKIE
ncbi:fructose-1,6-bisphosphatase [Candidatus Woesearchaeota archaeon]|nr:fructose-1,6-bisphosphatase [Candidatus Woesearchaeota archaeon]